MSKTVVAILNYNGKPFLERFLPLLRARTSLPGVSFLVIDNGSVDGSVDFLYSQFPDVHVVRLDRNYGYTGGYNRGLQGADADYYVLLNSDVEVSENWLQPLLSLMEGDGAIGACMPKIRAYGARDYFEYAGAAGGFIDRYGYPFCRGRVLSRIEQDKGQYDDARPVFWATGACLMVRAALYRRLGGLDEAFFAHMEEVDFCWRAQKAGYRVMCEPRAVVYHVGGGTLPNNSPQKIYFNYRNSLYMLYKNLPTRQRRRVLVARMSLDGLSAAVYLLTGRVSFFAAVVRAHIHFWQKRRQLTRSPDTDAAIQGVYPKSIVWQFFVGRRMMEGW
ncbi:MAG: glycosyltransferase family 2 protein [Prevotellaceae bacterium]|jgi:GT2 family glycosyltransferase|nr:glycosyltransferase family 2 protein [Prevotellaceae bacterium]